MKDASRKSADIDKPFQRGLTWNHPRGYGALEAAAARVSSMLGHPLLHWDRQALEGFESHPIGELARDYDLLVIDHPHIGEAVALDCLVPMERLFSPAQIAAWDVQTIGPAMRSYLWAGQHWALPLDVATQVMALRPDLLRTAVPQTWGDVVRLSETHPVAISIAGPHAILNLFALCAALGHEPTDDDLLPDVVVREAWPILARLHARAPADTSTLNPIGLLEAMAHTDAIALVPLIYGYVNYAVATPGRQALAFNDVPFARPGGRRGSVLGGTGIAVSRRCIVTPPLADHLAWLMSEESQVRFIPNHAGQPSARAAWSDASIDATWAGFYRRTAATVGDALVRPRFDGYIAFQTQAAAVVRAGLDGGLAAMAVLGRLRTIWRDSRAATGAREA